MKIWFSLIFLFLGTIWALEPAWGSQDYITEEIYLPMIEKRIESINELYNAIYEEEKQKMAQQKSKKTIKARVFGYTSLPELTDSTPFITASGQRVEIGGIANNCKVFGTKVQIGEQTFTVNDRMASRYGCSDWDIWFPDLKTAQEWGVKNLEITIYANP